MAGFKKFRELFCPQLATSQAYALHAIRTGKKTLAQHRTEQRDRKRRSRAKQKPASANSVTVTEISESDAAATSVDQVGIRTVGTDAAPVSTTPISLPADPRPTAALSDHAVADFLSESTSREEFANQLGKNEATAAASEASPNPPAAGGRKWSMADAKAEFKHAIDKWWPLLDDTGRAEIVSYFNEKQKASWA
jgi:hypothetical protein